MTKITIMHVKEDMSIFVQTGEIREAIDKSGYSGNLSVSVNRYPGAHNPGPIMRITLDDNIDYESKLEVMKNLSQKGFSVYNSSFINQL